jgi:hypothetical protein
MLTSGWLARYRFKFSTKMSMPRCRVEGVVAQWCGVMMTFGR